MPHIAVVGRRALKTRLVIGLIYLLLSLGGITMVVPFWLMLTTSVTSNVDSQDYHLIPPYLHDDEALLRKFAESAYNEDSKLYNYIHIRNEIGDFKDVAPPAEFKEQLVSDYDQWKSTLRPSALLTLHGYSVTKPKISLMGAHRYQAFLAQRFDNSIEKLNEAYREDREYFDLQVPNEGWHLRVYQPLRDRRFDELEEFKRQLPSWFTTPAPVEGVYREIITNKHDAEPATFAKRYNDPSIKTLADLTLQPALPSHPALAEDWIEFMRKEVPFQFVEIMPAALPSWHVFLKEAYHNDLNLYRKVHHADPAAANLSSFEQITLPAEAPTITAALTDWGGFIERAVNPAHVRLATPEILYRQWLQKKFGTIEKMNQAYGTSYASFDRVLFPSEEADWWYLQNNIKEIRRDFLIRNYRDVAAYITVHGRALWVTFILVTSTILLTISVNPLAAYALSRYNLPSTYKILLFCLATMAFPPEVTAIPNFLLMKQLHLLNTLWALILPGAAAGFAIFLLKGFFDGLPQELYEAAEMDGASEFQMFTKICLPMSTPVLAVIGLSAFTGAYGSFMWAFVVCQDKNWWTLMVWLQQMQSWAPQSMIFAALVLAAIPTLLVFIFAQNVIMRGVIIPMEK